MLSKTHSAGSHLVSEIASRGAVAFATALVAILMLAAPTAAAASMAGRQLQGFPRLATWWGNNTPNGNAARDYYVPYVDDPLHPNGATLATLRTLNPDIVLLASASGAELNYSTSNNAAYDAERLAAIPTAWLLMQVGSTLSSALTAGGTSIAVASAANFRVNDLVVLDDEKCIVSAIAGSTLTLRRGYAGSVAVAHVEGTRIAAVVSAWPGAATLNMTISCPLGRATGAFPTPSGGTERASDWLARRTAGSYRAADWDGVLIDVCVSYYTACFRGSTSFRTIADPTAPSAEIDYTAFDQAWQTGLQSFLTQVRVLVGPESVILTNGAPQVSSAVNGTTFEGFPTGTTTASQWQEKVIGPARSFTGSYLDWSSDAKSPNLSTVMTFGGVADYRLMRFGLTTALMGDGFFAYEEATWSHSSVGRWYDEFDNAGAGRGYLGQPTGTAVKAGNAYRRDYANGIALVNPTASAVTVQLGASFRKINGTQDRTVNDGSLVTAVTLQARDGIVLLRVGATPPPIVTYTLTYAAGPGGTLSGSFMQTVNAGAAGTAVTAVAASGYHFVNWSDGATSATRTDANVTASISVTANFAITPVLPPADTTAPATTSDAKATYVSSAAIRLAATDDVGVTATYFIIDGGAQTAGTTISVANDGTHTIQFWSVDAAGNVEVKKSATFTITVPLPTGTMTVAGGAAQVSTADVAVVSAVNGATEMRIDAGSGTFGAWTGYAASTRAALAHTGINTVRVEYRNAGGTIQLTDTVELIVVVTPPAVDPTVTVPPTVDPTPTVPPTPVPATVTLRASSTTIDYGHSATLNVAVVPAAPVAFTLEKRAAGQTAWTLVTTMTSNDAGLASMIVSPLVNTDYRVVLADGTVPSMLTIQVKALATVRSSRRTVSGRRSVTFAGTVSSAASLNNVAISALTSEDTSVSIDTTTGPPVAPVRAVLQRKVRHHWVTVKTVSMDPSGSYRVRIRPPRHHARYSYRIYVVTSAANRAAVSRIVKIRVH